MTKEDIVKQSLQQFLLHGIRKITIQQIIACMGISTKTVYKYFKSKEELLEACLTMHYQGFKLTLDEYIQQDLNPVMMFLNLFQNSLEEDFKAAPVFYHDLNYYYPNLQDKIQAKELSGYGTYMLQSLNKGIEQGFIIPGINPPVVLHTFNILYRSITRSNEYIKYDLSPFELAANSITVYLRGICTTEGLRILNSIKSPLL
ncbi:MAG: TetR/AcrR family transcriptional regulator [Bacteroidota bacterium]